MVKVEPAPYKQIGFQFGASTAREQALRKSMDAGARQTAINQAHSGGSKEQITVPQISTGASSDRQLNEHIAGVNKALMDQQANSEFDRLALSNSIKTGGRKRKSGRKTTKSKKTTRKTTRKTRKHRKNKRKN
jgi:hypothetical protein